MRQLRVQRSVTRQSECLPRVPCLYTGVCECSALCVALCGWQCVCHVWRVPAGNECSAHSWIDLGTQDQPQPVWLLDIAAFRSEKRSDTGNTVVGLLQGFG